MVGEWGRVERVLEMAYIAVNRNTVPGEESSAGPGGLGRGGGGVGAYVHTVVNKNTVPALLDRWGSGSMGGGQKDIVPCEQSYAEAGG